MIHQYKMNVPQRYKDYSDRFNITITTDYKDFTHEFNKFINIIEKNVFKHLDLFVIENINIIEYCEISFNQIDFTQNICVRFYVNNLEKPYIIDSNGDLNKANEMLYDEINKKEFELYEIIICTIVGNLKESFRKLLYGIDERFKKIEDWCTFKDYQKRFEEENGKSSFYDYNLGNENYCFCHPIGGDNVEGFIMQETDL